jgi:hypothetical protein
VATCQGRRYREGQKSSGGDKNIKSSGTPHSRAFFDSELENESDVYNVNKHSITTLNLGGSRMDGLFLVNFAHSLLVSM